jgi:Lactate dehydrogenase and related dehydrogenases
MKKRRILIAESENYSPAALEIYRGLGEVRLTQLDRQGLLAAVKDCDVLVIRLANQIDEQIFASAPNLRAVISPTTGLDHIDLEAAEKHGVRVLSLRGEVEFLRSIPATAELTWALLLALTRRIPAAFGSVLSGEWQRDLFKGHDLAGRRLGILGLGRVGTIVARYGIAFGMQVSAFDPAPVRWVEGVKPVASMQELFAISDVLSVHVPLNSQTTHLVVSDQLESLPPGAVLINTARGDVLDEAALLAALESGRLAGAALDVLPNERSGELADSPLVRYARTHTNLILTPHIGGATYESMAATEVFMAKKLGENLHSLNM